MRESPSEAEKKQRQRLFIQEANKLNSYPSSLKRDKESLFCNLKRGERRTTGVAPHCWVEIPRCSRVTVCASVT